MTNHSHRSSASFGKRQEYVVISELLRKEFDVYMTLVDDQGIDCIIRLDPNHYLDIQIKARSKTAKQWNFFGAMNIESRENYYFIFYIEKHNWLWVIPSYDVTKYARQNKTGDNIGKYSLSFPKSEESVNWNKFSDYFWENGFELLRKFSTADPVAV